MMKLMLKPLARVLIVRILASLSFFVSVLLSISDVRVHVARVLRSSHGREKKKNLKKRLHLLLISSDKAFPGLPVIASAGFTRRQHRFAFFSLGRATEDSVTRSVFSKPKSRKKCYHEIRIF